MTRPVTDILSLAPLYQETGASTNDGSGAIDTDESMGAVDTYEETGSTTFSNTTTRPTQVPDFFDSIIRNFVLAPAYVRANVAIYNAISKEHLTEIIIKTVRDVIAPRVARHLASLPSKKPGNKGKALEKRAAAYAMALTTVFEMAQKYGFEGNELVPFIKSLLSSLPVKRQINGVRTMITSRAKMFKIAMEYAQRYRNALPTEYAERISELGIVERTVLTSPEIPDKHWLLHKEIRQRMGRQILAVFGHKLPDVPTISRFLKVYYASFSLKDVGKHLGEIPSSVIMWVEHLMNRFIRDIKPYSDRFGLRSFVKTQKTRLLRAIRLVGEMSKRFPIKNGVTSSDFERAVVNYIRVREADQPRQVVNTRLSTFHFREMRIMEILEPFIDKETLFEDYDQGFKEAILKIGIPMYFSKLKPYMERNGLDADEQREVTIEVAKKGRHLDNWRLLQFQVVWRLVESYR